MRQGHSLHQYLGRVHLWRFCLIKYAHNGPFNGPINIDILDCTKTTARRDEKHISFGASYISDLTMLLKCVVDHVYGVQCNLTLLACISYYLVWYINRISPIILNRHTKRGLCCTLQNTKVYCVEVNLWPEKRRHRSKPRPLSWS